MSLPQTSGKIHPCQYAGYIDVTLPKFKDDVHKLFYWFFRHEDASKPVVLWMNGGPGASSMFGVFLENGPLRVHGDAENLSLTAAAEAWSDHYNLIFIDQPINTGFSYGNQSLTSMVDGADEFLEFTIKFF